MRAAALAIAAVLLAASFSLLVRPWLLRWGATDAEIRRVLPGDEIVPAPRYGSTRAITIRAAIAEVWPWLAQLGRDRGGFYSFEILEDLAGAQVDNADRIHPEFQSWSPGDKLWMYPADRIGGQGHALLVRSEPGRVLAFATRQLGAKPPDLYAGSWSFILEPIDTSSTRCLVRGRAGGPRSFLGVAFDHFVFDPMHFVMERRMMEGIQLRAEGRHPWFMGDVAHVLLWTMTFGLFIASAVLVFRREQWPGFVALFLAAGAVFQILTFAQPSPAIGTLLVLALTGAMQLTIRWRQLSRAPGLW